MEYLIGDLLFKNTILWVLVCLLRLVHNGWALRDVRYYLHFPVHYHKYKLKAPLVMANV
jgi:hypothetical protein